MADEKPIFSKPFSTGFSFNTSKSASLTDVSSRTVTTAYNFQSITTPSTNVPINSVFSVDNLLTGGNNPLPSSDTIIRPLPSSFSADSFTSSIIPSSTSISDYLNGTRSTIASPLALSSLNIVGPSTSDFNLPADGNYDDAEAVVTDDEVDNTKNISVYLNNLGYNALNDYDQATYHLKLFMAPAEDVLNRDGSLDEWYSEGLFSDDKIIVIAESGVTAGLYIESFVVTDIVEFSPQFNTSGVTGKMVIKEPLGANFIDYYNGAIAELGYETRIQAPVFLEISFRGYDENGNYMSSDIIGTKLYRFMTQNIEASFLGSGTQYDIDYVVLADIARQMAIANTSNNITVQGKTVKDFYDKLMEEWNKDGKDIEQDESQPAAPTSGTAGAIPSGNEDSSNLPATTSQEKPTPSEKNEFTYIVDGNCTEMLNCLTWEVGKATAPDRHRTANTTFEDGKGTIEATWGPGSDRVGILLDILYSTKTVQTLIVNGKQDDEIRPGSKELGGTSYLPEIDVQVEQTEYNEETHTYNKKITYIIQERKTTKVTPTPKEINEASKEEQAIINKLGYVRRRYDYFGTGRNTEILEFNIKIKQDFMINLPAYNAQKRTSVADTPNPGDAESVAKQVADGTKVSTTEGVKKPTPVNPDARPTDSTDTASSTTGATTSITDQNVDDTFKVLPAPILNGPMISYTEIYNGVSNREVTNSSEYLEVLRAIRKSLEDFNALPADQQAATKEAHEKTLRQLYAVANTYTAEVQQRESAQNYANILSDVDNQLGSIGARSKPLDSITLTSNVSTLNLSTSTGQLGGTLQYGATADYLTTTITNPVARSNDVAQMGKRFLEDFSRIKSDSPKGDIGMNLATVSTDIQNRGGYNLDDTSGIGKSYITALLSGVYGEQANMAKVDMEVRGDPFWLAVRNKATRDQAGSQVLKDTNGNDLPPSDHKILLTVVFPNQYDENTGLAIPNKLSEGYTAFYNLKTITSTFDGGKFTQRLEMYQDQSTQQVRKYIDPAGSADI